MLIPITDPRCTDLIESFKDLISDPELKLEFAELSDLNLNVRIESRHIKTAIMNGEYPLALALDELSRTADTNKVYHSNLGFTEVFDNSNPNNHLFSISHQPDLIDWLRDLSDDYVPAPITIRIKLSINEGLLNPRVLRASIV